MDAALQQHLAAMRSMGGEQGYGILGIALLKDAPGFGKAHGLEDLLRMILCVNPSGQNPLNFGNPNGFIAKFIRSLGLDKIFDQMKEACGSHGISYGGHHDGPVSSGLDTSKNEVGHTGSAISYD